MEGGSTVIRIVWSGGQRRVSKTFDVTGDKSRGNVYFVDYSQDSENYRVLFQPTSKMIESIKRFNPRNVFVMED